MTNPTVASAITVKFVLLPEERRVVKEHLLEQARNGALSPLAREMATLTAQALTIASRNLTIKRNPECLRALALALEAASPLPVSLATTGHQARARGYMAGSIRHELARRGL